MRTTQRRFARRANWRRCTCRTCTGWRQTGWPPCSRRRLRRRFRRRGTSFSPAWRGGRPRTRAPPRARCRCRRSRNSRKPGFQLPRRWRRGHRPRACPGFVDSPRKPSPESVACERCCAGISTRETPRRRRHQRGGYFSTRALGTLRAGVRSPPQGKPLSAHGHRRRGGGRVRASRDFHLADGAERRESVFGGVSTCRRRQVSGVGKAAVRQVVGKRGLKRYESTPGGPTRR